MVPARTVRTCPHRHVLTYFPLRSHALSVGCNNIRTSGEKNVLLRASRL